MVVQIVMRGSMPGPRGFTGVGKKLAGDRFLKLPVGNFPWSEKCFAAGERCTPFCFPPGETQQNLKQVSFQFRCWHPGSGIFAWDSLQ